MAKTSFIGKCSCGAAVAASWTWEEAGENRQQVKCHGWVVVFPVDGRVGKRECGTYCEEGKGRKCTCQCGGERHGLAWRTK